MLKLGIKIEVHCTNSTVQGRPQGRAGKAWVPKFAPRKALAGSSENIRPVVAEMRRAIVLNLLRFFEIAVIFRGYLF